MRLVVMVLLIELCTKQWSCGILWCLLHGITELIMSSDLCRSIPLKQLRAHLQALVWELPQALWAQQEPLQSSLIWTCSVRTVAAKRTIPPRNLSPRTLYSPSMDPALSHNNLHKVHTTQYRLNRHTMNHQCVNEKGVNYVNSSVYVCVSLCMSVCLCQYMNITLNQSFTAVLCVWFVRTTQDQVMKGLEHQWFLEK